MAWKPKTIFGKIIKGAVVAGGSVLGLATGIGGIKGIVGGVGALKGASKGIGGLVKVVDKVKEGAVNLVTGTTKDERAQVNEVKKATKAATDKLEQVQRLIDAGATPEQARATVGLSPVELSEISGEPIKQAGMFDFLQNKNVLYIVGGLAALYFLPKLLKGK
jgi:hypothetical protein